jgi:hypothetical protein
MKWLRSNIRHGSRLALLALAVQFVLWFGHAHGFIAQASPSVHSAQHQPAPGHDSDQHQDDFCAICAAVALTSSGVAAAPPSLPVPQAFELVRLPIGTMIVRPHSMRAAFQSRAPPLS